MIVVDASVWVSVFFATDVFHERSRQWMQRQNAAGQTFVAPAVILAEVAGAVSRRSGHPHLGQEAMKKMLDAVSVDVRAIDRNLAMRSAEVAAALSLKGADATYVALAQQLSLSLVTWDDEQLQRGSQIIAVQTPDFVSDQSA